MERIRIARPAIGQEEKDAVSSVLDSGNLVMGNKVRELEESFSRYQGGGHAIAVSSGTSALQVGLESLGIRDGDEVITTPFTFIATSNSILYSGARPVFSDIGGDFNLDPGQLKDKITDSTKAVLAVHLFGNPCRMAEIQEICDRHGIFLIEDCAQSIGAEEGSTKAGSFGDLSTFSFYATKNMITGEGGMILTRRQDAERAARQIRHQGQSEQYLHERVGFNFRMTDMQAAIGIEQLKKVDSLNSKRIENARFLSEGLRDMPGITIPEERPNSKHVFHLYTIRVHENRDKLQEHLDREGIDSKVFYPMVIYQQPAYKSLGIKAACPEAERASNEVLSLPVHPLLKKEELERIVASVKSFF